MRTEKTIEELKEEIETINKQIIPLQEKRLLLNKELRQVESIRFIESNGVTCDNIQLSSGEGVPYHHNVWEFAEWMKDNSTKRFCEWNRSIYFSDEIKQGRMDKYPKGKIEHIKGLD